MTPRGRRQKGDRTERELVQLHRDRVPLSGLAGGTYTGDVVVAKRFRCESKARANGEGFVTLEGWLGTNDALFLRRNRAAPLVVMQMRTWFALLDTAGFAGQAGD